MLPYGMILEMILPPTVLFTVKEIKLKRHDDTQNCVILCVAGTKHKKTNTTVECMKTGFSPTKVSGIACCDHKMSSASSLSPYQAVCCTEHSPLALGAGHTSWHPSPRRLSFSLYPFSVSFSLPLSLWLSFTRLQWPTLPSHPYPTLRGSVLP